MSARSLSLRAVLATNPAFRLFWIGSLVSSSGVWMQNVAQGWLLLDLSDSPFILGLAGFASLGPTLAFSILGGALADRLDRRVVLVATNLSLMTLALLLGALTSLGLVTAPVIVGVALLNGVAVALNSPAYQAAVADLVAKPDVGRALALNSIQFNLSRVAGHALGGVLVMRMGAAGCFYVNGLTYVVMLAVLWHLPFRSGHVAADRAPFRERVDEGFRFFAAHRMARDLLTVIGAISLFGLPYFFLLPAFNRDVLGRDAGQLGYLLSAVSAGALAGGLCAARVGERLGRERTAVTGAMAFWVALLGFATSRQYPIAVALLAALGFALILAIVNVSTFLQTLAPAEMRGRVMSVYTMALNGLAPVGSLLAGTLAERTSPPLAVGAMGAVGLAVAIVIASRLLGRLAAPARAV